jgi:hypothetical protein
VEAVDLRWPSGIRQTVRNVKADQVLTQVCHVLAAMGSM